MQYNFLYKQRPQKRETMSKVMRKVVLFLELSENEFQTPSKICHLFMNRFAVDDDASFEILNIFELGKTSEKIFRSKHPETPSIKEMDDLDVFDAGVKSVSDFGKDDMVPHKQNYCGRHYIWSDKLFVRLTATLLTKMRKIWDSICIFHNA